MTILTNLYFIVRAIIILGYKLRIRFKSIFKIVIPTIFIFYYKLINSNFLIINNNIHCLLESYIIYNNLHYFI
jgi:hypothetical protein